MNPESSWKGLVPLEEKQRTSLSLPIYEVTRRRWTSMTMKHSLTRHQICWWLDIKILSLQKRKNKFPLLLSHPDYGLFC